jgi:hypothetical protein
VGSKFVPLIVTAVPGDTIAGVNELMVGALDEVVTVNDSALVTEPLGDATVIGPVVAPVGTETTRLLGEAELMVAAVPLKLTVSCAAVALKLAPVIVTCVPTGPDLGVNENSASWPLVNLVIAVMLPTAS